LLGIYVVLTKIRKYFVFLIFYFRLVIAHVCVFLRSPTTGIKSLGFCTRKSNNKRRESKNWQVWQVISDSGRCKLKFICIRRSCTNFSLRINWKLCLKQIGSC